LCGSNVVPRYGNARNTFWSYFCQISDSTTSYGSYSGAVPNEKTWGKLDIKTPKFIIESDADCSTSYFCLFIRSIEYIMKRVIVDYAKYQ
jgi:deoxyhypusine synthase